MMFISRRVRFAASHRLHNPELSPDENRDLFGACNNPHGHGHDYEVEVVVRGHPDARTGMFLNLRDLKELLETHIVSPADRRSLDHEVAFMRGKISSTENLAVAIWNEIAPRLQTGTLHLIRVRESENNVVEYTGP